MSADTLVLSAFNAFLMAGLSGLLWTRLNRIDDRMDRIDERLDRIDERIDRLTQLVAACATRTEVEALRSDLTQVALAVGARPRRAGA